MIHFYLNFWRPDLLPQLEWAATLCGGGCKPELVTVDPTKMTCEQCKEVFNADSNLTGIDWKRQPGASDKKDRVRVDTGWSTDKPKPSGGWSSKVDPLPKAAFDVSGWSTGPVDPWKTK